MVVVNKSLEMACEIDNLYDWGHPSLSVENPTSYTTNPPPDLDA
jgi:hypothetical protein